MIKKNQFAKKIESKRVSLRFCNASSKVITKTVIIIIPNKQGRACTWREGCASCAKRKCFPAGWSEPFLNGMMKQLLWLDCNIQEAILEEQFGKLTKKEQKKVQHPNCLIWMHGHRSISKLVQGNGLALGGGRQPLGGCLQNKLHSRLDYSKLQSNFRNNLFVHIFVFVW